MTSQPHQQCTGVTGELIDQQRRQTGLVQHRQQSQMQQNHATDPKRLGQLPDQCAR